MTFIILRSVTLTDENVEMMDCANAEKDGTKNSTAKIDADCGNYKRQV
jgi:hypothetical protein